jgi:hypothetical protein
MVPHAQTCALYRPLSAIALGAYLRPFAVRRKQRARGRTQQYGAHTVCLMFCCVLHEFFAAGWCSATGRCMDAPNITSSQPSRESCPSGFYTKVTQPYNCSLATTCSTCKIYTGCGQKPRSKHPTWNQRRQRLPLVLCSFPSFRCFCFH